MDQLANTTMHYVMDMAVDYMFVLQKNWPLLGTVFWADVFSLKCVLNGTKSLQTSINSFLLLHRGGTMQSGRVIGSIRMGMHTVHHIPDTKLLLFSARRRLPKRDFEALQAAKKGDIFELLSLLPTSTDKPCVPTLDVGTCVARCIISVEVRIDENGLISPHIDAKCSPCRVPGGICNLHITPNKFRGKEIVMFPGTLLEFDHCMSYPANNVTGHTAVDMFCMKQCNDIQREVRGLHLGFGSSAMKVANRERCKS